MQIHVNVHIQEIYGEPRRNGCFIILGTGARTGEIWKPGCKWMIYIITTYMQRYKENNREGIKP